MSVCESLNCSIFFFFQAEDGIRDYKVTGVQTCALPIWLYEPLERPLRLVAQRLFGSWKDFFLNKPVANARLSGNQGMGASLRTARVWSWSCAHRNPNPRTCRALGSRPTNLWLFP